MRGACIDIGSNTTRLLVAELRGEELGEVLSARAYTPVAGPDGLRQLVAIVSEHVRLAREAGATELRVVGTAALRGARDPEGSRGAIEAAVGVPVEILSGAEEGRLTFLGAMRAARNVPPGLVAVVDVGGGSVELVCGTIGDGVEWATSLPVGSATLTARHVAHDPPTAAELDRMRDEIQGAFAHVVAPPTAAAYAVAGGATSLRALTGTTLDREQLEGGLAAVCAGSCDDVAARFGLETERVRLLAAGFLLLETVRRLLQRPLHVARGGLREGVIWERLGATSDAPEKNTHFPGASSG